MGQQMSISLNDRFDLDKSPVLLNGDAGAGAVDAEQRRGTGRRG
jgi:hypothetical protein